MSRLEVPLIERKLRSTGDMLLHAELTFLVDSGTEMTTMQAAEASKRDLPVPRKPVPGLALKDQEVRSGLLRARVVGMDPIEYVFPCYFLGDPTLSQPVQARNLLGLSGVVNQLRLSFDGRPYPGARWGILVVET
jgi:hypothetical protein